MGRSSLLRRSLILPLIRQNTTLQSSSHNSLSLPSLISQITSHLPSFSKTPTLRKNPHFLSPLFFSSSYSSFFSLESPHLSFCRSFSSSTGPSNIVLIESEEELNSSLNKAQDDSLPAVFYFTAVWCGPCKFISPFIEELSKKYPHVSTYKIDIDKGQMVYQQLIPMSVPSRDAIQEGLGSLLSKLKIYSVPTFHFFQNGKKAAEIVGADVTKLKDTMEELYK